LQDHLPDTARVLRQGLHAGAVGRRDAHNPEIGQRTVIPLNQMSQNMIDATLAAEDAFFYSNPGFDLRATLRSAVVDLSGTSRTGASTITQQLVRNVVLSPEERHQLTISRKLREIILASELSQRATKDQILGMYLNNVYLAEQSYGVEAACQTYCGEHARDLDLAQAALMAGLIQSPTGYDPTRTDVVRTADGIPVATKARQPYVLEQMTYHGFITRDQAQAAYAEPLHIQRHPQTLRAPHWVMYIPGLLEQKYGSRLYTDGLSIYTTLDAGYDDRMHQVLQDAQSTIATQGASDRR
jgi:membrane peptidoglycan carboxypeptidase